MRLKTVTFSPVLFTQWVTQGNVVPAVQCLSGVPEGSQFVRGFYDGYRNVFGAVYEHPAFDDVPDGQEIPEFTAVLQAVG
jgi:hypothetical protein